MKRIKRLLSVILALVMLCSMLAACSQGNEPGNNAGNNDQTDVQDPGGEQNNVPAEEYTEEIPEGHNQITFYWSWDGSYENCDMWIWWGDKAGKGYLFHECEYGGKVIVNVPEGVTEVGFIVRRDCSDPG